MIIVYDIQNSHDLVQALNKKEDEIVVTGSYCKELKTLIAANVPDSDYVGVMPGQVLTQGFFMPLFSNFVNDVLSLFDSSNLSKEQKEIKKRLRLYNVIKNSPNKISLRLKQLDY